MVRALQDGGCWALNRSRRDGQMKRISDILKKKISHCTADVFNGKLPGMLTAFLVNNIGINCTIIEAKIMTAAR